MYILGISCYYHDAAAALLKDGDLIAAAEEERFTRNKHDPRFPDSAIAFCLTQAGIKKEDVDYFVFYEKPLLKFDRFYQTIIQSSPNLKRNYTHSWQSPHKEKLWVKEMLLKALDIPAKKLLFVEHHMSHAASSFFCSPYEEAAILTIDGTGEWATATIGKGTASFDSEDSNNMGIDLFKEVRYPHSIGLMYTAFTTYLGFKENSGEYKVMGMAPYGTPRFVEEIYKNIITLDDTGGFRLNMNFIEVNRSMPWDSSVISEKFKELFGPPREVESEFYTLTTHPDRDYPNWDEDTARKNQHYADIAASIQIVTEEAMLKMANYAYQCTGSKNLAMAGGCALNSVANGRILRETPFESLYIQPASADSGASLGAALYVYHALMKKPRKFVMEHPYWGKGYNDNQILSVISTSGYSYDEVDDSEKMAHMITDDLVSGKVVSLCQGRFEWGPRSLGNRSIIADPRTAEMKSVVNEKIKFREPFRPFAPVVLEECATEYFEGIENPQDIYPLRFMLAVCKTKKGKAKEIQAVTHEDGSGRVQTARKEWNPLWHRTIELFGEATGVPVILNTSFNLRGEPVVNSPTDALRTFGKSGLESLYIGNYVVRK